MSHEQSNNGVLLGTIIGGAIGVISALLLAPKSGAELREDLSAKFQSISEKTKDVAASVGKNTKEVASTIKEEASELVDHAKKSNQNILNSLSSTKEDMMDDLAGNGR